MQATLVAYYGNKPTELADFIQQLQGRLKVLLSDAFHPYAIEQVHGTIIGLEGIPRDGVVLNKTFYEVRGEVRPMDLDGALKFMRTTHILPLRICMGGFKKGKYYPFTSLGMSPYDRSFAIQREIVVTMGWPVTTRDEYPTALHQLRCQFQKYNILHKYLRNANDVDNDFYLVLGKVAADMHNTAATHKVNECLRSYIAERQPLFITLSHDDLAIVCYISDLLPPITSVAYQVTDESMDGLSVLKKYTST